MTTNDKLKALIEKAIEDGWDATFKELGKDNAGYMQYSLGFNKSTRNWFEDNTLDHNDIIFNHDFAKALFKTSILPPSYTKNIVLSSHFTLKPLGWEDHLQKAVISDDPISYMYGVVFDE